MFFRGGQSTNASLRIIEEWSSIAPLIQCHAFDQAAFQLLLLRSIRRLVSTTLISTVAATRNYPMIGTVDEPFSFKCKLPRCAGNLTARPFWSCNPLFDMVLNATGWFKLLRGQKNFPRLDIGVWITSEDGSSPRLHVVEKSKLSVPDGGENGVPSSYKGWDYGGNFKYDWNTAPHSPTWFVSHHKQTLPLFFSAHQTNRACGINALNCTACAFTLKVFRI